MLKGKIIYRSNVNGDLTIDEQIELVKFDLLRNTRILDKRFEDSLRYDIVRTITNILGNSVIKYKGVVDDFCESLQRHLLDIFFMLHENGRCFLVMGENNRIKRVTQTKTQVEIVDPAYIVTGITQKKRLSCS